jgi:hypothetical protein
MTGRCAVLAVEFLNAIQILITSIFPYGYTSKERFGCCSFSGVLGTAGYDIDKTNDHIPDQGLMLPVINKYSVNSKIMWVNFFIKSNITIVKKCAWFYGFTIGYPAGVKSMYYIIF